ncbi:MORN repeat-containing protein 2-like isoform X2 [Gigantopelta aegis]|uniref:MORN repeat-containing protein 2-like isoform X2 n=1 Tax=Gigantopelta aegis TaxID=1735272 RepID=UPI001B8873CB|nr:MORN repeat-containing protein 2-like isoform X2 [Gigantopelta aegis]
MPGEKKKEKKKDDGTPEKITGIYVFPNGDKYEGEYIQSAGGSLERNGFGTHTTTDGVVYEGDWVSDKMTGRGKLTHPSGAVYEGEFLNNKFNGQGKYVWPNGSFYEGQFVDNRLQGDGQFTDTDIQKWTGTFRYRAAPGLRFKLDME